MKVKKVMTKKKKTKIFLLFFTIFSTTITLIVSTYSWFVGISTVNVSDFNVSISAVDGLKLSLDGSSWSNTLTISKSAVEQAYNNNSNKWPDALVPVSTGGEMNSSVSRIKFYDKQSLSPTAGGYRIVANQMDNYTNTEANGYIVFDLFIKNGGGGVLDSTQYGEDIFLSGGSNVSVPVSGATPNYGAANSIRVGFFRIGYLGANASSQNVQAINCSTSGDCSWGPSGISGSEVRQTYQWNIWEPNANKHTNNLISYYNMACKKRDTNGYIGESCIPLETGIHKLTYSIKDNIVSNDDVDIYDGVNNNGYSDSSTKLISINTYKTSDATSTGASKSRLLELPGNSITKVRVYIWLEGQDVDNYDLITKNQSLNINFGFTKDRFGLDTVNNNQIDTRTSSFEDDSWEKIKTNVQAGNTSQYNIGDTRQVRINGNQYTVRLANKSKPSECNGSSYSQTACGFVVEFVDIVENRQMNSSVTNIGGWQGSQLYTYLQGDFYNSLSDDLKNVIIPTRVVSSHGNNSGETNFISQNDKLYLLSTKEMYDSDSFDSAASVTRQLDYYSNSNVTPSNNKKYAIKSYNGVSSYYWTRTANGVGSFRFVDSNGDFSDYNSNNTSIGYAPAFRIG